VQPTVMGGKLGILDSLVPAFAGLYGHGYSMHYLLTLSTRFLKYKHV
jgi:hypothetical protein